MKSPLLCCVAAVALAGPLAAQESRVRVVESNDTMLVVRLGPVRLPAGAGHGQVEQLTLQTWQMPGGGWLRGYRVEMVDAEGRPLPASMLHHAELVDLERRDLLRDAYNRVVSAGKETSALLLPPGMGYPVRAGQEMGINAMLHNPTRTTYRAAYVQATLTVVPAGTPSVRNVLSFYAETSFDSTGDSSFDLPPGRSDKVVEFTVPAAGQVLAVGGHIHDFGTRFVVVRADRPDTLYDAAPRTAANGAVSGMPTQPMFGRTVRVEPGDRFIMTVYYNNPTGRRLAGAGMGTFGVVFSPDDVNAWPALDPHSPGAMRDLAALRSPHQHMMRQGMQMDHSHH